jgi:hypothetical protein
MAASRPPLALRILGTVIPAAVVGAIWLLAAAMLVTGVVLWRDWHALAREGIDHQARVERCEWKSMQASKRLLSVGRGSGFYSCDYVYRVQASGPAYSGHFQSPRQWHPGEVIGIRYRSDRPSTSATVKDLAHPSVAPGALILLPLLHAGWQFRGPLRQMVRRWRARGME